MSNTDFLRRSEAVLLPPEFIQGKIFKFKIGDYEGLAEVDGWSDALGEAIEICQSETLNQTPKPGQKRKMASDVLKLVFLKNLGFIKSARVYITSPEMYTWLHRSGSWLSAACRHFGIKIEQKQIDKKQMRRRTRNVMSRARRKA